MSCKTPMGNIREDSFDNIWNSDKANNIRNAVDKCSKQCWMVGNAVPVIKKHITVPVKWIIKNKIRVMMNKKIL